MIRGSAGPGCAESDPTGRGLARSEATSARVCAERTLFMQRPAHAEAWILEKGGDRDWKIVRAIFGG